MIYQLKSELKQFNLHIDSSDRVSGNNNNFTIDWSNADFSKNKPYMVGVKNFSFNNNVIQNTNLSFTVQETTPLLNKIITIPNGTYNVNEIINIIQAQLTGMANTYLITFDSANFNLNIQASTYVSPYLLTAVSANAAYQLGITDLTTKNNNAVYSFGDKIDLVPIKNVFLLCDKISNTNFHSGYFGQNIILKVPLTVPRNTRLYYATQDFYYQSCVINNAGSQARFYLYDDNGNLISYKGEIDFTLYFIPLQD